MSAISIVGLIYGALFAFIFWIANGLLVARLRSEAVRVSERQMPVLHAAFMDVCARLGLPQPPALYLLQSGGALNKVRENSQMLACKNGHRMIDAAFDQHVMENGGLPGRVEDFIGPGKVLESVPACMAGGTFGYSVDDDKQLVVTCSIHGTIADMDAKMPSRH